MGKFSVKLMLVSGGCGWKKSIASSCWTLSSLSDVGLHPVTCRRSYLMLWRFGGCLVEEISVCTGQRSSNDMQIRGLLCADVMVLQSASRLSLVDSLWCFALRRTRAWWVLVERLLDYSCCVRYGIASNSERRWPRSLPLPLAAWCWVPSWIHLKK